MIHTVGPIYNGGKEREAELLASCYRRSLEVAVESKARSIAFPAISCGVYGYPLEEASAIAVTTVREGLRLFDSFEEVVFVLFSEEIWRVFVRTLEDCD